MFYYIDTFDRSNSCEIFSIVLDQCEQCGDRSCRSVRKEAQESEGGTWDVGRDKDSAHMRDHRDDHVDVDDDRFERRLGSLCVAMREIATFLRLLFVLFP